MRCTLPYVKHPETDRPLILSGIYIVVFVTSLFRTPKLDERQIDEDAEEAEEEGLLANTGRRFNATWQDITGRVSRHNSTNVSSGQPNEAEQ